jgi:hypothetical protein
MTRSFVLRAGIAMSILGGTALAVAADRLSRNEVLAIGDLRTFVSAEAAFAQSNNNYFGEERCLLNPQSCNAGTFEPPYLYGPVTGVRSSYTRTFHGANPGSTPGTFAAFAITAEPVIPGRSGTLSFCMDSSGTSCSNGSGEAINVVDGQCPVDCQVR